MEKWLADNILKLLGTIAACGWFLIQLGEWKARMQERKRAEALHVTPQPHDGTTRESIELLVMRELVDARHALRGEFNKSIGDLSTSVWKEINKIQESQDLTRREVSSHGERIARLEPKK